MSNILRDRFTQILIGVAVLLVIVALLLFQHGMEPPKPAFVAEWLFEIPLGPLGTFRFTNSILMTLLVAALLVIVAIMATRRMSMVPGRLQNFVETIVEMLLGLVESTAGKRTGRIVFPLIATLFIFIITANWLSLLPIGWFGICRAPEVAAAAGAQLVAGSSTCPAGTELVPILRAPNADLNMTLAMALIAFIVVQVAGVVAHGVGGYAKELSTPWPLTPVHLVGELSRIISLSFRLFGNIFGGEVLLAVMYFLLGSAFLGFATVIFIGLELLFGLIQALIFSMLTLVYISMAVGGHGDHIEETPAGHELEQGIAERPETGTAVAMG